MTALLDLVCGPAGPLPETHQRYRLVQHLGSGGQAEVYRAVRVCSGVSSAPMTVKVFRVDPQRPIADELRSWDKGDAALMDLNNRGVPGICRRADGFWGPPPHPPGQLPPPGDAVPIQVYDYLPGLNLREYVQLRPQGDGRRLNAAGALAFLARILRDLHNPADPAACPVLHMDIKPSNVMVLPSGEIRLIDFTGARYHRADHITQIAYTSEAGGPEALSGKVGPAYDVHGFGAVAYFLVTGAFPRSEHTGLRVHPMLDGYPKLRHHLLAPLADNPVDRPKTLDLPGWVADLAELVRAGGTPDLGVEWAETSRTVGRASVPAKRPAVAGTESGAFDRIEKLERELVKLREVLAKPAVPTAAPAYAVPPAAQMPQTRMYSPPAHQYPPAPPPYDPTRVAPPQPAREPNSPNSPGRASVPRQPEPDTAPDLQLPHERVVHSEPKLPPAERARLLARGWELSAAGASFAFVCWGIWAFVGGSPGLAARFGAFLFVLVIAAGMFALCRLLGLLVLVRWLGRTRRSARLSHVASGVFLVFAGLEYLGKTGWLSNLFG
ncbi:protein kinase domain-containing protein [Longispora albida]|uniref:protein kinase domain-containing protein n=1 Tax=Longispora albida TaxID=203523 RepID=UPI0003A54E00|nr:hypothetical protein [Longispora albida]